MSGTSSFVTLFTNTMKLPLVGGVGSSVTAADERPALTAFAVRAFPYPSSCLLLRLMRSIRPSSGLVKLLLLSVHSVM